jgi:exopolysaccharide biosynthesis polyprenyl glycosylphosphotransferase
VPELTIARTPDVAVESAEPRSVHHVPGFLVALDLAAVTLPTLVVPMLLGPWSPVVQGVLPFTWLLLLSICGGYATAPGSLTWVRVSAVQKAAVALAAGLWMAVAVAPGAFTDLGGTSRSILLLTTLVALNTLGLRRASTLVIRPARVVVAGDPRSVSELLHDLDRVTANGQTRLRPVAVVVPMDDDVATPLPVWPGLDRLADAAYANDADAVLVVPGPHLGHDDLVALRGRLRLSGTDLIVSTGLRDTSVRSIGLDIGVGTRLLLVRGNPWASWGRIVKDVVDRTVSAVLLVLLAPVLAALALLVRFDSPGPAFFRQTRVGRDGRTFTLIKLRTMSADAEDVVDSLAALNESDPTSPLFKIRLDPRITPLGALLRRYSLDELPQLVNVLLGHMSLIGPRPALPSEVSAYDEHLLRRLAVKPGMTGLWQVSGRSDLPWRESVRLDLAYVDNWSWRMDLVIAIRTFGAVVSHRGAY